MPISDIILNSPYVLVTLANSPAGIVPSGSTNLVFGYVERVNELCDSVLVGEYVFFDRDTAKAVQYGSTVYYLVDETFNLFKEIPPP